MGRPRDKDNKYRKAIYEAIRSYWKENRRPPSIRDICALANVPSTSTVAHHLDVLEEEGKLVPRDGTRSIVPTSMVVYFYDEWICSNCSPKRSNDDYRD